MSSDQDSFSQANESNSERQSEVDYPDQLRSRDDDHAYLDDDRLGDDKSSRSDSDSESDTPEEINIEELRMMQLIQATTNKVQKPDVPIQVPQEDWITPDVISKYEYTRLIGIRAKQILQCSAIYVDLTEEEKKTMTPMDIAEREFKEKTMPLKIKRVHPNGEYEMREIKDMIGFFQLNDILYQ